MGRSLFFVTLTPSGKISRLVGAECAAVRPGLRTARAVIRKAGFTMAEAFALSHSPFPLLAAAEVQARHQAGVVAWRAAERAALQFWQFNAPDGWALPPAVYLALLERAAPGFWELAEVKRPRSSAPGWNPESAWLRGKAS
jgi:hypothetical protein